MNKFIRTLTVIATASALTFAGTAVASAQSTIQLPGSSTVVVQEPAPQPRPHPQPQPRPHPQPQPRPHPQPQPPKKSEQAYKLESTAQAWARYKTAQHRRDGVRSDAATKLAQNTRATGQWRNLWNVPGAQHQSRTVNGNYVEFYKVEKYNYRGMTQYFISGTRQDQAGKTWGVHVTEDNAFVYITIAYVW